MNIEGTKEYWIKSSDQDYITMGHLYNNGDYTWSLFIAHIVLEKLLKAYFISTQKKNPPFIHDLLRLAEKSGLELNDEKKDLLDTVTTFNIRTRYDDYSNDFRKKCSRTFTEKHIQGIKEFREWIKKML